MLFKPLLNIAEVEVVIKVNIGVIHKFAKKLGSSSIYFYIDNISASLFLSNSRLRSTLNLSMFPGFIFLGRSINGTSRMLCSEDSKIALPSSILPTV